MCVYFGTTSSSLKNIKFFVLSLYIKLEHGYLLEEEKRSYQQNGTIGVTRLLLGELHTGMGWSWWGRPKTPERARPRPFQTAERRRRAGRTFGVSIQTRARAPFRQIARERRMHGCCNRGAPLPWPRTRTRNCETKWRSGWWTRNTRYGRKTRRFSTIWSLRMRSSGPASQSNGCHWAATSPLGKTTPRSGSSSARIPARTSLTTSCWLKCSCLWRTRRTMPGSMMTSVATWVALAARVGRYGRE